MTRQKNFFQKVVSKIKPGFWFYVAIYTMILVIFATAFLIFTENVTESAREMRYNVTNSNPFFETDQKRKE